MTLEIPALALGPGVYSLDAAAHARDGAPYDYRRDALRFEVTADRLGRGRLEPAAPLELRRSDPLGAVTASRPPDSAEPVAMAGFLRGRFTREGTVGLYLTAGFFACAAVVVVFAMLADSVFDVHGETAFDREITLAIEGLQSARDRAALAVSFSETTGFSFRRRSPSRQRSPPRTPRRRAPLLRSRRRRLAPGDASQDRLPPRAARPLAGARVREDLQLPERPRDDGDPLRTAAAAALVLHVSRNPVLRARRWPWRHRHPLGLLHARLPGRALDERRRRRNPRRPLLGERLRHRHASTSPAGRREAVEVENRSPKQVGNGTSLWTWTGPWT